MKHRIEFSSVKTLENLKIETSHYFSRHGFKMTKTDSNSLQFEVGSRLRNMITFNPLKWKSRSHISFHKHNVIAVFDIDTSFELVTSKEELLWKEFISNYQKTIELARSFESENLNYLTDAKKSSWKYIGYALLGALIFGIPFGFIAHVTKVDSIVGVGAAVGALIFVKFKINQEKKAS